MAHRQFDSYKLTYYSGPDFSLHSVIMLFSGQTVVGRINFMREGFEIRESKELHGIYLLNFHEGQFSEVLDILRNEEPLFIELNASFGVGSIRTSEEPIGEEENG